MERLSHVIANGKKDKEDNDRQVKERENSYEERIVNMTVEINRLTENISYKARECEDYKRDCERLS